MTFFRFHKYNRTLAPDRLKCTDKYTVFVAFHIDLDERNIGQAKRVQRSARHGHFVNKPAQIEQRIVLLDSRAAPLATRNPQFDLVDLGPEGHVVNQDFFARKSPTK
jgi:hypothetical protein